MAEGVLQRLVGLETGLERRARAKAFIVNALPGRFVNGIKAREYSCEGYDKIFACAWLDTETVVVGTKCFSSFRVNVRTGLLTRLQVPVSPGFQRYSETDVPNQKCGIRALSLSPTKDLIVTGTTNPTECVVCSVHDFKPIQFLVGHSHWIFSSSWVNEDTIITGSRDGTLKLWRIDERKGPTTAPLSEGVPSDKDKVRDVKASNQKDKVISLSSRGEVSIWSTDLRHIRSEGLSDVSEPICVDVDSNNIAVGTLELISFMDSRSKGFTAQLTALPDGNGVRSLSIQGNLLTAGYSHGQVCFHDLRNLSTIEPTVRGESSPQKYLTTGTGWFPSRGDYPWVTHGCLAHSWDPTGTKLLTCGGPIRPYLRGCYIGLWS